MSITITLSHLLIQLSAFECAHTDRDWNRITDGFGEWLHYLMERRKLTSFRNHTFLRLVPPWPVSMLDEEM